MRAFQCKRCKDVLIGDCCFKLQLTENRVQRDVELCGPCYESLKQWLLLPIKDPDCQLGAIRD